MFKILTKVDKNNFKPELAANPKNPSNPIYRLFSSVKTPVHSINHNKDSKTELALDVNRVDHDFIQEGNQCKDVIEIFKAESRRGEKGKGPETLLLEYYYPKHPERKGKLDGLCQDVGRSVIDMVNNNFYFKLSQTVLAPKDLTLMGKAAQNFVKVNEDEYRFDHEELLYLLMVEGKRHEPGRIFCRNSNGIIMELPFEAGSAFKNAEVGPAGQLILQFFVENEEQIVECLPMLKSNATAHLKFKADNEPEVTVSHSLDCLDMAVVFNSEHRSPEMTVIQKMPTEAPLVLFCQEQFPGLNTVEENKCLEILANITETFKFGAKQNLSAKIRDFAKTDNKIPMVQMGLYSEFFQQLKLAFNNKEASLIGWSFEWLSGAAAFKDKVFPQILKWEKIIASTSAAERLGAITAFSVYLNEVQAELKAQESKSYGQRLSERWYGPAKRHPVRRHSASSINPALNVNILHDSSHPAPETPKLINQEETRQQSVDAELREDDFVIIMQSTEEEKENLAAAENTMNLALSEDPKKTDKKLK